MISLESRMRQANPIPDAHAGFGDDDIAALLILTRARSTDMDVKEMTTPVTPDRPPQRGWLVAAAAAAVVVLAVGAVLLLGSGTDDLAPATTPSTTGETSPTTTLDASPSSTEPVVGSETATTVVAPPELDVEAAAFVRSLVADINAGDHVAASARIEPVPQVNKNGYVPGVEEDDWTSYFQGMYEYWVLVDSSLSIEDCRTSNTSGVTRCSLVRESSEAFTSAPEELVVRVRLEDGVLAYYEQGPNPTSQFWLDFRAFDDWLYSATYSDDTATYNDWFSYAFPAERVAVQARYGTEWVDLGQPTPPEG